MTSREQLELEADQQLTRLFSALDAARHELSPERLATRGVAEISRRLEVKKLRLRPLASAAALFGGWWLQRKSRRRGASAGRTKSIKTKQEKANGRHPAEDIQAR